MKMLNNLAIIHTQFGPYHFARAKALIQTYRGSVNLIQLASREEQRQWTVEFDVPPVITVAEGTLENVKPKHLSRQLIQCLENISPAVIVIAGYAYPAMRAAASWAKKQGVKTILLSDSQGIDRPRNLIKENFKSLWIRRHYDAAFVAGASAASYLEDLRFPKDKIWRGYDVVDNDYFTKEGQTVREASNYYRKQLNLPQHYFLFVGRLAPEKNLACLLKAYQLYCQHTNDNPWSLVILGSGSEENGLKATASQLGLEQVLWLGFKQVEELPAYYALASALILPSINEPWGLVVNEAMACRLPILLSDRCGCLPDLVFPGINGSIFNPLDVTATAQAMIDFSSKSEERLQDMGQASQQIIAPYTPQNWAIALTDCIEATLNHKVL